VFAALASSAEAPAQSDWNDKAVGWKTYEAGLAAAAKQHKPICLVFWAGWCPHCRNYAKVFGDPKVVALAQRMVMIRIDDSEPNRPVSSKYPGDGEYVPRTFFLSPDGKLAPELDTGRKKFRYFYDEADPQDLARSMEKALASLK
jgi:thiol:disulfide interchange protein